MNPRDRARRYSTIRKGSRSLRDRATENREIHRRSKNCSDVKVSALLLSDTLQKGKKRHWTGNALWRKQYDEQKAVGERRRDLAIPGKSRSRKNRGLAECTDRARRRLSCAETCTFTIPHPAICDVETEPGLSRILMTLPVDLVTRGYWA